MYQKINVNGRPTYIKSFILYSPGAYTIKFVWYPMGVIKLLDAPKQIATKNGFGSIGTGSCDAKQTPIGAKIIARETVASFRKDVTQKLYGGDVTRKNKLLDKQKKGKKRMRQFGKVDIPQNAFLNALKMHDN